MSLRGTRYSGDEANSLTLKREIASPDTGAGIAMTFCFKH